MSCVTHIYSFDDIPLSFRNWRIGQRVYLPQRRSFQLYYLVTSKIGIHGLHLFTKPPLHCAEGIFQKARNLISRTYWYQIHGQFTSYGVLHTSYLSFFASKKFSVGRLWPSDIKFLVSFNWSKELVKTVAQCTPSLPKITSSGESNISSCHQISGKTWLSFIFSEKVNKYWDFF